MDSSASLFEQLVSNPRHPRVTLGGALVLLLIPLIDAFAEGSLGEVLTTPGWRGLLVAPTIILYILFVAPRLERTEKNAMATLRPAVLVDDSTYEQLVVNASSVSLRDGHLKQASTSFLQHLVDGRNAGSLAQEISALSVIEQRLQGAQTWPYNMAMLRTLFVSVLVPFFTMLGKFVLDQLLT
jgi:hypothetical protein